MKFLLALLFCAASFAETVTLHGTNVDHDAGAEDIWGSTGALTYLASAVIMDLTSGDVKEPDYAVGVLTLIVNVAVVDIVTIG